MVKAPEYDFGSSTMSLLDQMDAFMDAASMQRLANKAVAYLSSYIEGPAEQCESMIKKLGTSNVSGADVGCADSMTVAVMTAAVLMAARDGRGTSVEKAKAAMDILEERYQAGW